ncbi:prolyl aminopeptidase [Paractinoplanes toevensis]|uniref:prolyl aminopeptidase n=1 Tax=Paractinoplanes toevensis TaxID=571911 RepID=UPI001FE99E01|nr:prolyl aminopeptidase [Actinoplanes toevensis]
MLPPETQLLPEVEPYATHSIDVGDGHTLYVEEVGNPAGIPAVFLHGGPGGGLAPFMRRFFDPARYRIVLFDQRGAGRSTPLGSLHNNTTWHLVADIETIRRRLGISAWLVFGGSWGSALALAYAETHPAAVTGLILRGICLVRAAEREWVYQRGLDRLQPEEWQRFIEPIPPTERDDILAAYHRRLLGPDPDEARKCADAWMRWEAIMSTLVPDPALIDSLTADETVLPAARILADYAVNGGFFTPETQLLDDIDRIRHIPGVIIQGRYDQCCPPITAYDLATRWPEADFQMVPAAGHASLEPAITARLIAATNDFADRLT